MYISSNFGNFLQISAFVFCLFLLKGLKYSFLIVCLCVCACMCVCVCTCTHVHGVCVSVSTYTTMLMWEVKEQLCWVNSLILLLLWTLSIKLRSWSLFTNWDILMVPTRQGKQFSFKTIFLFTVLKIRPNTLCMLCKPSGYIPGFTYMVWLTKYVGITLTFQTCYLTKQQRSKIFTGCASPWLALWVLLSSRWLWRSFHFLLCCF